MNQKKAPMPRLPIDKPENVAHYVNQEKMAAKKNDDFETMM